MEFLIRSRQRGYSVCINGDGFELMQTSVPRLARDLPEVVTQLRRFAHCNLRVYYVVGNHDLLFEHFLADWGGIIFAPFLNLRSGNARIRIEHGFLYDPFFVNRPDLYETLVRLGGYLLKISPRLYRARMAYERLKTRLNPDHRGIAGEPPQFADAARAILQRGFDGVIFGHTHHRGMLEFEEGQFYVNTGSWMLRPNYAEIDHGKVTLREWQM